MSPEQAVREARAGTLRPVYFVLGEERYLQSVVVGELRRAVIGENDLGLNDDHFDASEADADKVLAAARTLPMMAARRLVIVRSVERWEPKTEAKTESKSRATSLDKIADYAAAPSPTTTVVLVAGKIDNRRRLVALAKKEGFVVECDAPSRNALPAWLARRAKERGKTLGAGVAELLADVGGPELSRLDDAIERLSLYVGDRPEIDEDAVTECVVGVKPSSVWELVSAVGRRDLGASLRALAQIYDPKDRGLPLLGTLAWSTRQLVKFSSATARGLAPAEAAKFAGAPPFKAGELAEQTRRLSAEDLERWLGILAQVDLGLKGGSKRPPRAILEAALVDLCGAVLRGGDARRKSPEVRSAGERASGPSG